MTAPQLDPTALGILRSTPSMLRALLGAASDDAVNAQDDAGWCARDVLAHIVDVDAGVTSERIRRIVDEERPFIRSIDPHARLREGGYAGRTASSLLDELDANRPTRVAWLQSLSEAQLARAGEHDQAGEISASDIAHQWAYHDLMHLTQIATMLQSTLVSRMGNTRKFYDV